VYQNPSGVWARWGWEGDCEGTGQDLTEIYYLVNASRNSVANFLAASTGFPLSPIVFTHAEPTMTPSASAPTWIGIKLKFFRNR